MKLKNWTCHKCWNTGACVSRCTFWNTLIFQEFCCWMNYLPFAVYLQSITKKLRKWQCRKLCFDLNMFLWQSCSSWEQGRCWGSTSCCYVTMPLWFFLRPPVWPVSAADTSLLYPEFSQKMSQVGSRKRVKLAKVCSL